MSALRVAAVVNCILLTRAQDHLFLRLGLCMSSCKLQQIMLPPPLSLRTWNEYSSSPPLWSIRLEGEKEAGRSSRPADS